MDPFTTAQWSPYLAGAGIGIIVCLAMLLSGKPLGTGTTFTGIAGMAGSIIWGRKKIAEMLYFRMFPLEIEWQWMLVLGIVLGGLISSALSGSFRISWIPPAFLAQFGDSPPLRIITALIGGIIVGIGARWCWGCPSSHGMCGIPQLSLASFVAVACMFAVGIGTAFILFSL